jgi:hypothetical protein
MQRSGNDDKSIKKFLFFILLYLLYEPLTTVFIYIPPLLSVATWYIFQNRLKRESLYWLIYLFLFELDHSLPFLSLMTTSLIVILLLKKIESYVNCLLCLIVMNTLLFYAVFSLCLLFFNTIFSTDYLVNFELLVIYAILDLGILFAL